MYPTYLLYNLETKDRYHHSLLISGNVSGKLEEVHIINKFIFSETLH
jgi:hypothetical protein